MDEQHAAAAIGAAQTIRGRILLPLAFLVLSGLVAQGLMQRHNAESRLAHWTEERAVASVALLSPHFDDKPRVFTLPGQVAAYYDAAIHGQVSGYVKEWRKDIGAVVKKGEVLAVIDTPELDELISETEQEVLRAKAAQAMADVTAQRWSALRSTAAVSQQASDEKESDLRIKRAEVGAAAAKLERLLAQKAFAHVVAPFDGVVTARNIDIGALVTISGESPPLFKVADIHAVRVYVNAPQSYAADLRKGVAATLTFAEHPGRAFDATIATTSNAIESQTRTLLVELDAQNPNGALLPGAYAEVRFALPAPRQGRLRIPASALSIDEHGVRVATFENGRAHFKKVALAHDYGAEVEVESGLSADDRIINNPGDALADGDDVRVAGTDSGEQQAAPQSSVSAGGDKR